MAFVRNGTQFISFLFIYCALAHTVSILCCCWCDVVVADVFFRQFLVLCSLSVGIRKSFFLRCNYLQSNHVNFIFLLLLLYCVSSVCTIYKWHSFYYYRVDIFLVFMFVCLEMRKSQSFRISICNTIYGCLFT